MKKIKITNYESFQNIFEIYKKNPEKLNPELKTSFEEYENFLECLEVAQVFNLFYILNQFHEEIKMVHYDIKPANLLMKKTKFKIDLEMNNFEFRFYLKKVDNESEEGIFFYDFVLSDFGLSRPLGDEGLDEKRRIAGTPLYMTFDKLNKFKNEQEISLDAYDIN